MSYGLHKNVNERSIYLAQNILDSLSRNRHAGPNLSTCCPSSPFLRFPLLSAPFSPYFIPSFLPFPQLFSPLLFYQVPGASLPTPPYTLTVPFLPLSCFFPSNPFSPPLPQPPPFSTGLKYTRLACGRQFDVDLPLHIVELLCK